jgi:hypothetical protein
MKRFELFAVLMLMLVSILPAHASVIEILPLDTSGSGTISGSTYTLIAPDIVADGVTFTATLTVVGNGATVDNNSNGLGVDGTTINAGEALTFSLATSAVTGGVVTFDGFTSLDFNGFTGGTDGGIFSLDAITPNGDDVDLGLDTLNDYALPSAPVTQFTIFGTASGFQLDDVSAQFTGSTVPEPSAFLFCSVIGGSLIVIRRLKRSSPGNPNRCGGTDG